MNFQTITQDKYLQYFLSADECKISDAVMTDFLNDMIGVSERMDTQIPPTEIIKEVMNKLGLEGAVFGNIRLIASSKMIETLTALEVFALLWFISCRNIITYEEGLYLNMANDKTIGNLLKRLSVLCK